MVKQLINKLLKLDIAGASRVKYFGVSVGTIAIAFAVAYYMSPKFKAKVDQARKQLMNRITRKGGVV